MNIKPLKILCTLYLLLSPAALSAQPQQFNRLTLSDGTNNKLSIQVDVSQFNTLTEKPYLALWYSLPNKQYTPLKVLRADSKWLRDLKSFWRFIARYQREKLDGITAATVKPGLHQFVFELPDKAMTQVHQYWLEVVRENGKRELLNISMPPQQQNKICVNGTTEVNIFCVEYH